MSAALSKPEPRDVPIALIDEPQVPARMSMDDEKFDELCADIRKRGIFQRLILVQTGDRYEVVAGHRRFKAAQRLDLASVPADVFPTMEAALEGVKHAENRFREDLSPAEEAAFFSDLLERHCGGDVDRLCELVGESFDYVSDRLNLFAGCPVIFEALKERKIKLGVAIELNKVTDERVRRALLYDCVQGGATVAVAKGMVMDWKRSADLGTTPLAPLGEASMPGPIPETNFFTCICCGRTDNVHLMQPVNVHTHCRMAILDPLLEAYNNPGGSR